MVAQNTAFGGPHRMSWRNIWTCLLVSSGQIAFGYPASIIGTTLGQPSFLTYMGLITPDGTLAPGADGLTGAMSGVFQAGAFFGVLLISWLSDKYGRKTAFIYCAVLSLFGGALLCASQNPAMFIVFRFFAGAGSWGFLCVTPTYTAELSPPEKRGFFVGLNGVLLTLGYAIASYMGLAFFFVKDGSASWRGPLGIALIWPLLILCVLPLIPESPRWLLMNDRPEDAWIVVNDLHGGKTEANEAYARGEFYQMQQQTQRDVTLNPTWSQIFKKSSYRKRALLTIGYAFISQSCGPLVINNYGPTIYQALGFGPRDQLILECGWISVGPPTNLIGAWVVDKWGRRPLMVLGAAGCCITLTIEAAMIASFGAAGNNKAGLGVGVMALYLFIAVYGLGVDVGGYVFYSEIWPNHLRSKGLALAVATNALTDLVYLQVTPTAFENIGWKFFLVFIIISGLGAFWVCFTFPETKNLPLEELGAIFGDGDDIAVYSKDIQVDHTTHAVIVNNHDSSEAATLTADSEKAARGTATEHEQTG